MIYRLLFPESHYSCLPESRTLLHIRLGSPGKRRGHKCLLQCTACCGQRQHTELQLQVFNVSAVPSLPGASLGHQQNQELLAAVIWNPSQSQSLLQSLHLAEQRSCRSWSCDVSFRMIFARLVFHLGFWLFLFFLNAKQQFLVTGRSFAPRPSLLQKQFRGALVRWWLEPGVTGNQKGKMIFST